MLRPSLLAAIVAFFACAVTLPEFGNQASAESAVANPMKTQNPMLPNPGRPMSPMGIAPMQPLGGLAGQPESNVARDPEFDNLPISPGMEETYYSCTACHSVQTFAQMRLTDERWEYLWDWMIKEQGMPEYDGETREIVLKYLQEHFSSQR
jgi:hypothetical protein